MNPVLPLSDGSVLRPYEPSDLPSLLAGFADPEVRHWNPGPDHDEPATAGSRWMQERNNWSNGTHASWAVGGSDGRLLGSVSLHKVDREQGDAEIGYWLAPWARGRGTATMAVQAATGYAFDQLGLHRVYLFHATENPASCRVATAAGFALEGRLRQSYRYADGVYRDEHLHARLVSDPPPALTARLAAG